MSAIDPFSGFLNKPSPVYDNCAKVIPSDTDELPVIATTLHITRNTDDTTDTDGGWVCITTAGGQTFSLAVPHTGPLFVPVRVRKVWATGTTATSILALW